MLALKYILMLVAVIIDSCHLDNDGIRSLASDPVPSPPGTRSGGCGRAGWARTWKTGATPVPLAAFSRDDRNRMRSRCLSPTALWLCRAVWEAFA